MAHPLRELVVEMTGPLHVLFVDAPRACLRVIVSADDGVTPRHQLGLRKVYTARSAQTDARRCEKRCHNGCGGYPFRASAECVCFRCTNRRRE